MKQGNEVTLKYQVMDPKKVPRYSAPSVFFYNYLLVLSSSTNLASTFLFNNRCLFVSFTSKTLLTIYISAVITLAQQKNL